MDFSSSVVKREQVALPCSVPRSVAKPQWEKLAGPQTVQMPEADTAGPHSPNLFKRSSLVPASWTPDWLYCGPPRRISPDAKKFFAQAPAATR